MFVAFVIFRNILGTDEEVIELLRRYNDDWKTWSYRDVIPVQEKYSEIQKEYFLIPPDERKPIINKIINSN